MGCFSHSMPILRGGRQDAFPEVEDSPSDELQNPNQTGSGAGQGLLELPRVPPSAQETEGAWLSGSPARRKAGSVRFVAHTREFTGASPPAEPDAASRPRPLPGSIHEQHSEKSLWLLLMPDCQGYRPARSIASSNYHTLACKDYKQLNQRWSKTRSSYPYGGRECRRQSESEDGRALSVGPYPSRRPVGKHSSLQVRQP